MKKIIEHILLWLCAVCPMVIITGCDDKEDAVTAVSAVEAVYVSADNQMVISLKDNATLQLTPFIMPQNAKNKEVTYENKNHNILDVSSTGLITPKAVGSDTLTIRALGGPGIFVSYRVDIIDHIVKATSIDITAAGSNIILKKNGASFDLSAHVTVSPADTWDKTVTYTSADESVATVSAEGIVTPVEVGSTTVTVTTADGSNISRACNVTVQDVVRRNEDVSREGWTVTTQTATGYTYVPDGTTGLPEHLFDGDGATFLSLVKPGKSYGTVPSQDAGFMPSFTVDMKSQHTFNYIKWRHRQLNNLNYLRVYGVDIEGSNDGLAFTPINTAGIVWIPNTGGYVGSITMADPETYIIDIPETTCRYVKVRLVMWSDIYNSQNSDHTGEGAKSGSTMQVSEFGLGKSFFE